MIKPRETVISGGWIFSGNVKIGDDNFKRIEALLSDWLVEIVRDSSGWDVLLIDPADKRLWEMTYPHSELSGGGPPMLAWIDNQRAQQKYGALTSINLSDQS